MLVLICIIFIAVDIVYIYFFVSRSNKVCIKLLADNACEAHLDLDALTGLTEISLEIEEAFGFKSLTKLGVSVGPPLSKVVVPSQLVTLVPRYILMNESEETILVRQCYLRVVFYFVNVGVFFSFRTFKKYSVPTPFDFILFWKG